MLFRTILALPLYICISTGFFCWIKLIIKGKKTSYRDAEDAELPHRACSLYQLMTFWYQFYIVFKKYFCNMEIYLMNVKTFFNTFMWRYCIKFDEIPFHPLSFAPKRVSEWFLSKKITKIVTLKKVPELAEIEMQKFSMI